MAAVNLANRHHDARGRIIRDFHGAEKKRVRVDDLLARFEEVRRAELLDESAVVRAACLIR
jgi:putative ABC transport system ATP-binding protein